jgi:hypothetical protein
MNFTTRTLILAITAAFALSACGNKDAETASAGNVSDIAKVDEKPVVAKSADAELPKGDKAKPMDQYTELNSGAQLSQAYYAFSGLPVPYEKLAEQTSVDYRQTQDSFKKQDILKALQPQLEQDIAALKKSPYLMLRTNIQLKNFDMQRKAFPVEGFSPNSYISYNDSDSVLTFSNTDAFQAFPQADEAKARELEAMVSQNPHAQWPTRAYLYVQDAKDINGRRTVRAQLLKLVVETPDGKPLFEI